MYKYKPVHCIKNGAAITAVHGLQDVDWTAIKTGFRREM